MSAEFAEAVQSGVLGVAGLHVVGNEARFTSNCALESLASEPALLAFLCGEYVFIPLPQEFQRNIRRVYAKKLRVLPILFGQTVARPSSHF